MKLGNFIAGVWVAIMGHELYLLMLTAEPTFQGWLGVIMWTMFIASVYVLGAVHGLNVPRR